MQFHPGRARRWPRRILITVNVVVAITIIGVGGAFGYVNWKLGGIKTLHIGGLSASAGATKPFTLLVVGSDSRAVPDGSQFGGASATPGQRSDTIILVRVVPETRQMTILSIPRDLWVDIPGVGHSRINAAFNSGAALLVQTIQSQLGIPINHYVEVNLYSFRQISDAVGGVNFYFPTPAKDHFSNLQVSNAGCVSLSGDQALAFVRSRHYEYYQNGYWHFEAESDLARIQRQQAFIKKMIKKAQGSITNPLALNGIISGVTSNLTVDSGFNTSLMLSLAKEFRSINPGTISNETIPNVNEMVGSAQVLGLQQPQASQAIAAFNALGTASAVPSATTGAPSSATGSTSPSSTAVTVPASSISVEVANGSGVTGQAGQATAAMQKLGYQATTNATLQGSGFTSSEIKYAPDALAAAQQLKGQLVGGATLVESTALSSSPYQLELVTGTSYQGVTSAGASGSGTSGSGTSGSGTSGSGTSGAGTSGTTAPAAPAAAPVATYQLPGYTAADAAAAAACQ